MSRRRYTGRSNAVSRPRKGERLKASHIAEVQSSISDLQSYPGSPKRQPIELVRLTADLASQDSVDAILQGFSVTDQEFSDIGAHAVRSVFNPYDDTLTEDSLIPVVRIGGAVVPVRGGGGGEAVIGITRTGGIAGRSTTSVPHTFPSATIDLLDPDTGNYYSPNREQLVYNSTSIAIAAAHIVQAKQIKGSSRYFVDVDDC